MKYNFDKYVDRRNTSSIKWEYIQSEETASKLVKTDRFFGEDRLLPMWIADMDFRSPQPVIDALVERARHGVYGYTEKGDSYLEAVRFWMKKRHRWAIKKEWICTTPGVVAALAMLVQTFVRRGEKVIIQPPVYYPFSFVVERNDAQVVKNPLIYENGRYRMDFEDLAAKARDPKVKMLILCSPHNPVGRVWTKKELTQLGGICLKNNVLVVSDEIHADLIRREKAFTPFARINKDFAAHSITCTAPSKTFNLAGLSTSNIIIPDPDLRREFQKTMQKNALLHVSVFGNVALEAAYLHGEEWLEQLLDYLDANLQFLEDYIREHIPQIRVIHSEGTTLAWLDCRALGLNKNRLKHFMVDEAGVYLDEGYLFGEEGEGFERINIACPRSILRDALGRISKAIQRRS